jgi:asparagine synthase (glutamine-hydrolysing)
MREDCNKLTAISESGAQPLTNEDQSLVLAVNGEIYNHRLIRKHLNHMYHFKTTSDCEVIIPLVRRLHVFDK